MDRFIVKAKRELFVESILPEYAEVTIEDDSVVTLDSVELVSSSCKMSMREFILSDLTLVKEQRFTTDELLTDTFELTRDFLSLKKGETVHFASTLRADSLEISTVPKEFRNYTNSYIIRKAVIGLFVKKKEKAKSNSGEKYFNKYGKLKKDLCNFKANDVVKFDSEFIQSSKFIKLFNFEGKYHVIHLNNITEFIELI